MASSLRSFAFLLVCLMACSMCATVATGSVVHNRHALGAGANMGHALMQKVAERLHAAGKHDVAARVTALSLASPHYMYHISYIVGIVCAACDSHIQSVACSELVKQSIKM